MHRIYYESQATFGLLLCVLASQLIKTRAVNVITTLVITPIYAYFCTYGQLRITRK
jgi:hypothetical protein